MPLRSVAVALGALSLVAVIGAISPADAGNGNYVMVDKVVDGPVPEGTVFEIEVDCTGTDAHSAADPAIADPPPVTLEFDANGDPLDTDKVSATLFQTCTVTETVTGGAVVSYACEIAEPTNGAEPGAQLDVSCLDDQTVEFGEVIGAEGTVTVTNTFEPEPPPAPAEPPPAAAPAGVVAARPTFTG